MAKPALAFTILPDSPPARLIEWSRAAEDAGFSGVFMTEANNDSTSVLAWARTSHQANQTRHRDHEHLSAPS